MKSTISTACRHAAVALATLGLLGPVSQTASAQVYAYPTKNQSPQQQQQDDLDCLRWATERTGFDPRRPPQYQGGSYGAAPSSSVQSGVFGRGSYGEGGGIADAGKGALGGAAIGAIAGDAGKGAAIGALSGLFIGGVKRSNQQAEREAWYRQQQQQEAQAQQQFQRQVAQMQAEHDRAYAACMSGRGYRVN
jgi:hypothetical protein